MNDMEDNILVSVVVPIWNVEQYLPKCIDSLTTQSEKHIQVIAINDGSPDHCGEILSHYAEIFPNLKVITKKNGGFSSARNAGLEVARGKYVAFVDSDDWVSPKLYSTLLAETNEQNVGAVMAGYVKETPFRSIAKPLVTKRTIISRNDMLDRVIAGSSSMVWMGLYRRDTIEDIHLRFDEELKGSCEDNIFGLQYFNAESRSVVMLPQCLYHYRCRGFSATSRWSPYRLSTLRRYVQTITALMQSSPFLASRRRDFLSLLCNECVFTVENAFLDGGPTTFEEREKQVRAAASDPCVLSTLSEGNHMGILNPRKKGLYLLARGGHYTALTASLAADTSFHHSYLHNLWKKFEARIQS